MLSGRVGFVVAALTLAGCVKAATPTKPRPDLPFDPMSIRAEPATAQPAKGPFKIELAVRVDRTITAADDVALRVVSSGAEVARVPVVVDVPADFNGERAPKLFAAAVGVPPGDYEVELVSAKRTILGHAFKIAEVPVWGGGKQLQFYGHLSTRVDLDASWLRLARWVVEDEPTQAYVIEWWHDGRRVWVTKGRTDRWPAYDVDSIVQQALPPRAAPRRSIWIYGGERYAIPKDLMLMAGVWEARVYREGAPPVAITFELSSSPDTLESRVAMKQMRLSAELFLRPLPGGLGASVFA